MSHLSVDVNYFDDVLSEEEISEIDEIAYACFANENATDQRSEEEEINFREVTESLNFDGELSQPPEGFDFVTFITALRNNSFLAKEQTSLAYRKNAVLDEMLSEDRVEAGKCFVKILWNRLYSCIRKALEQHRNESVKRKYFRAHFSDLHNLLMSSELEKQFLAVLRIPKECKQKEHWSLLTDVAFAVNASIIHEASISILDQLPTRTPAFIDINSLPDEVRGK